MDPNKLIRLFLLPLIKPLEGIHALIKTEKKLLYSVIVFLFLGIIYTVSVQLAWKKGLGAAVEPFVKIPAKDYYYWQRFYQIPFFFLTSIIFAGIVRLLSTMSKGKGSFEDLFALFCVSQTLPMFLTMWLPETIGFVFFPGQVIMPVWLDVTRQIGGILWPVIIMIIGITIIEKIKWYWSALFALIAAIPITALMIIFIR